MKTLKNNVIIYDDECPMCRLYTFGFTKTGMLDTKGRIPYTGMDMNLNCSIDKDRARNEIALIDTEQNTVTYGIDSLMKILSNRFSFLAPLFRFKPFYNSMQVFYKFISYNRRVIIPSKEYNKEGACTPDFNLKYRILYITLMNLLSTVIATVVINFFFEGNISLRNIQYAAAFIVFLIGAQSFLVFVTAPEKLYEYIGNFTSVIFIQSVLIAALLPIGEMLRHELGFMYMLYAVCVVFTGGIENARRIAVLKINCAASLVYPLSIYFAILAVTLLREVI